MVMRLSCNGCRVLRKACTDDCTIRPCLQWIKSPESQANATVFLAKFYGRAGLINLLNSAPRHLRPAIFRSLLYEACGRIVNPVYGSVGLLWTGSWQLCQAAVEAVLKGEAIRRIPSNATGTASSPPLMVCDIRHVSKAGMPGSLHKVRKTRAGRFKRIAVSHESVTRWRDPAAGLGRETERGSSAETVESSHVSQAEPGRADSAAGADKVGLDLSLGLSSPAHAGSGGSPWTGLA